MCNQAVSICGALPVVHKHSPVLRNRSKVYGIMDDHDDHESNSRIYREDPDVEV